MDRPQAGLAFAASVLLQLCSTNAPWRCAASLRQQIERWSRSGVVVLPDSSFYIEHPAKLEDVDLSPLVAVHDLSVHLLVPMVVIDELDGLTRSSNKKSRRRAAYTLALIDRLLSDDPNRPGILHQADRTPNVLESRGEVTIEALFDPPSHQRLPINDDEIIDRSLAAQVLAGTEITVITFDTG